MSIPAVAKIGVGSTLAIGTPASIYLTWDHITLYEVERKVINEDMKFIVEGPSTDSPKKITIKAPTSPATEPSLPANYTWVCEVTVTANDDSGISDLKTKIQDNLPKTSENINEKQRENKELLVRACSKNRDRSADNNISNNSVKGLLTLKKETGETNFSFENHSELGVLLDS